MRAGRKVGVSHRAFKARRAPIFVCAFEQMPVADAFGGREVKTEEIDLHVGLRVFELQLADTCLA